MDSIAVEPTRGNSLHSCQMASCLYFVFSSRSRNARKALMATIFRRNFSKFKAWRQAKTTRMIEALRRLPLRTQSPVPVETQSSGRSLGPVSSSSSNFHGPRLAALSSVESGESNLLTCVGLAHGAAHQQGSRAQDSISRLTETAGNSPS